MVCVNFDDGHIDVEDDASVPPKPPAKRARFADETSSGGKQSERQKAWLGRHDDTVAPADWKPIKVYRVSAKKLLIALDHQLLFNTCILGLIFFRFCSSDLWADWRLWPSVSLFIDFGCDYEIVIVFLCDYGFHLYFVRFVIFL